MADDRKRAAKSETLTIRLNPRTRFLLDFVSRVRGQTITTVVERALIEAAANTTIEVDHRDKNWEDFWDISEGVRALRVASLKHLFPTYEEEARLQFTKDHWQFFYADRSCRQEIRHYIDVLWPDIDMYREIFEETKKKNYFAAGEAMRDALKRASLLAPEWPPKPPPKSTQENGKSKRYDDLDEDVPF